MRVREKEEGAEACVKHYLVCAEPEDPVVTSKSQVPKAPLGLRMDKGRQAAALPGPQQSHAEKEDDNNQSSPFLCWVPGC